MIKKIWSACREDRLDRGEHGRFRGLQYSHGWGAGLETELGGICSMLMSPSPNYRGQNGGDAGQGVFNIQFSSFEKSSCDPCKFTFTDIFLL